MLLIAIPSWTDDLKFLRNLELIERSVTDIIGKLHPACAIRTILAADPQSHLTQPLVREPRLLASVVQFARDLTNARNLDSVVGTLDRPPDGSSSASPTYSRSSFCPRISIPPDRLLDTLRYMGFNKGGPYSLGKSIEWKHEIWHDCCSPCEWCPYSLGKSIEWKLILCK